MGMIQRDSNYFKEILKQMGKLQEFESLEHEIIAKAKKDIDDLYGYTLETH
jgi:hypothetical protein